MTAVHIGNVSQKEQALQLAKNDLIAYGKLFLPDDFRRSETPFFHYTIADKLLDWSIRQQAIILPRGHGKTVLTKANILHDFCFADPKDPLFYGWVAASSRISIPNLDYVKYHLEYNDRIKYYFGTMKGRKWTEDDIELANGCKLVSKSNLSGIRGAAKLHKRYELVVLDDFEDETNTLTPDSRSKIANLVTAVVFPALEPKTGRLRINGTPVHFDSFIQRILVGYEQAMKEGKDYSWDVVTHKAVQEDGTALWPSWFGHKELERKKKFYADSGTPQKFYQEYMMEVQSEEDSIFRRDHIRYWDGIFKHDDDSGLNLLKVTDRNGIAVEEDWRPVNVFVGVDPATDSIRRDADFSVMQPVAVDSDNMIYTLDPIRKRSLPVLGIPGSDKPGIVDYMFNMSSTYHPNLFVIEDTSMSKPVIQAVRSEMMRRNNWSLPFRPEKPGNHMSKRDRIQGILEPRLPVGQLHIKKNHYDLQREILTFGPRMAHDDTIDALAYAIKFAHPPNAKKDADSGEYVSFKPKPRDWVTS